jgi:hypothetical protein
MTTARRNVLYLNEHDQRAQATCEVDLVLRYIFLPDGSVIPMERVRKMSAPIVETVAQSPEPAPIQKRGPGRPPKAKV